MRRARITMLEAAIQGIILVISLAVLARASHYTIGSIEGLIEFLGLSEASAGFAILWRFLPRGGVSKVGGILLIISYVLFQAIL